MKGISVRSIYIPAIVKTDTFNCVNLVKPRPDWIIIFKWPTSRLPAPSGFLCAYLPWYVRWGIFGKGGGSVTEFGGSRVNRVWHVEFFRWHVCTVRRNEYHDKDPEERAAEYLEKWSVSERENLKWRKKYHAEQMDPETRRIMKEAFGIDYDDIES